MLYVYHMYYASIKVYLSYTINMVTKFSFISSYQNFQKS